MNAAFRLALLTCLLLSAATAEPGPAYWQTLPVDTADDGLTLIPLAALQQTTDYTCGPAAAVSLLRFYGREGDEMAIAQEMKTNPKVGTTPENMAAWFQAHGFTVQWGENGSLQLLRDNLAKNIPTLVEWSDWGGHWVIVIGYDTRNSPAIDDDVILFADPSDTHDAHRDGITFFSADRFDYMWYDALLFGRLMKRVYVTPVPAG